MLHSPIFSTLQKNDNPILLIDKKGVIGKKISKKLIEESLIVLVSKENLITDENLIHIPFIKSNPTIPDNSYSEIIIIDENLELNKKFLLSIFKKSNEQKTPVFIGIGHDNFSEKIYSEIILKYQNTTLGVLGDVFADELIYNDNSEINKIISGIKSEGIINIPDNPDAVLFPVHIDDVVDSILKIIFLQKKEKLYFITPKNPITYFTVASIFKKNFPQLKLNFYKIKKNQYKKTHLNGNYLLVDDYSLSDKIKKISLEKISTIEKRNLNNKRIGHPVFFTFLFFIFILILPFASTIVLALGGKQANYLTKEYLKSGDNKRAEFMANLSQNLLYLSLESENLLSQGVRPFKVDRLLTSSNKMIKSDYYLSKAYYDFAIFLNRSNKLINGESLSQAKDFGIALSSINNSNIYFNMWQHSNGPTDISEELARIYSFTSSFAKFLPEILGFQGKKSIIIYLVNNNKFQDNENTQYYLMYAEKGRIIEQTSSSTKSSLLSNIFKIKKVNTVIEVNQDFLSSFGKHINKDNLITYDLLSFLTTQIKNKNLIIMFDNALIQEALKSAYN